MGKAATLATELFRGLTENAAIGMIAFERKASDGSLSVLFANAQAREILEWAEGVSLDVQDLRPKENSGAPVEFREDSLSRDGLTPEVLMRRLNGHHFFASLTVKNVEVEGNSIALLSFRDVTIEVKLTRDLKAKQDEIERAYSELLEQNSQLKMLDQAKDKFIALTTHELRTPLSAILATADVLELKLYESEEQKEEFIRTISEQGRHLMELVNDILDFAKIRAGKMEFYVEHLELGSLIKKLISNFSHMAANDGIEMKIEGVQSLHAWADLLRVKEILNNVLSNAIKYNRKKGRVVVTLSEHTEADGRRYSRVAVRDTGHGIPPDKISTVFNEFETVETVSRHHKGTGLGMPISKRLIESMGGLLTLSSEVGVGTVFYVDLPIDKVLAEDMYRSRPDYDADLAA